MLSTPQTWVLLGIMGVLVTGLLSLVALTFQGLRSVIDARFDAVDARFDAVDTRFDAVDTRFDAVDRRFDGVDRRLDALDRDVQALTDRVFRAPS